MTDESMQVESTLDGRASGGSERSTDGPSKRLAWFAIVSLSGVFLVSVLLNPTAGDYFTVCGFKKFTGLPCPGCGLTHSFCALTKGNAADAFGFNLLGPVLFLAFVLIWVRAAFVLFGETRFAKAVDRMAERFHLVRNFAVALGVYGVVRIIYLLAYQPTSFQQSPLSRLILRLLA